MLRTRRILRVWWLVAGTLVACDSPAAPADPTAEQLRYSALAIEPAWALSAERDSAFDAQMAPFRHYAKFGAGAWRVARTPDRWLTLWDSIVGYTWPTPTLPAVDFASEMVVVAAHGPWANSGKGIAISHVTRLRDTTFVLVRVTSYTNCYNLSVVTSPVDARVVPLASPPTWFLVEQAVYNCETGTLRTVW